MVAKENIIDIQHNESEKTLLQKDRSNITHNLNKINALKSEDNENYLTTFDFKEGDDDTYQVQFAGLSNNDSICPELNDALPPIPDGGWGWVVVAAGFLISSCIDGLAYSFGLLHDEFTIYFEKSHSETSLIGSLFIATPLLAGPVMSALVDRYGCRVMTIIAGVLSTVGFLLAAVSNSVQMLCLTFGIISGLGMGILFVTTIVSVTFWFDKKRNLAVSLSSCGVGFGTLIYSPLTNYFLERYDWRNTLVLLGGSVLNMCICGALMRDPEWLEIKQKREKNISKIRSQKSSKITSSASSISSRSLDGESLFMNAEELQTLLKSGQSPEHILAILETSIAEANQLEATTQLNSQQSYKTMHSMIHLPTFVQQKEEVPTEVIDKLMTNKHLYKIITKTYPELAKRQSNENCSFYPNKNSNQSATLINITGKKQLSHLDKDSYNRSVTSLCGTNLEAVREEEEESITKPKISKPKDNYSSRRDVKNSAQKNDWFLRRVSIDHHYLKDLPLNRHTIMHRGAMLTIPKYKLTAASLPNIYKNSAWSISTRSDGEMTWYQRFGHIIRDMFDFRMFTDFHFLMLTMSCLILAAWFIVPYFFLNSYMISQGVEGGPTMISVMGVACTIGIVAFGWIGDLPCINVTKVYAICLFFCGLSMAAYPFFITSYWAVTIISTIFGLTFASAYSYTPIILMQLITLSQFTKALGMILLFQGVGHLGGPPLAGLLYDVTGKWDYTFYMGGLWLVISGLCVIVIAYTNNFRLCGTDALLKDMDNDGKQRGSV